MDKIIVQTTLLNCSAEQAFKLFTNNKHLEQWLTAKADIETHVGGKFELFWEPDNPLNNSTIGCKVLAVESPHYINFEWKGPVQFKAFMNIAEPLTNITIIFTEKPKHTNVTLIHTGWRNSDEWEQARMYFINAWKVAFEQLEKQIN